MLVLKIGALEGSSGANILKDLQNTVGKLEIVTFSGTEEIASAVEAEDIDAGIAVDVVAEPIVKDNPSLTFEPVLELGQLDVKIAFPKGSSLVLVDEFNDAIANLKESDVLDNLEKDFFALSRGERKTFFS
jgi:ABC-type amino acid transport substrate-binding protein